MKLPNWFRIMWWLVLLGLISYIMVRRHDALVTGQGSFGDFLVLLIWVALFLAPIFQEVDGLRTDIRNTIDVQAQINPTFYMPSALIVMP
jgi:hypothetical protein